MSGHLAGASTSPLSRPERWYVLVEFVAQTPGDEDAADRLADRLSMQVGYAIDALPMVEGGTARVAGLDSIGQLDPSEWKVYYR